MVDLHCHILPGLDDGAMNDKLALEMARMAVADGISDIVATPHTHNGVYQNDSATILQSVKRFQNLLNVEGIPLRIHAGTEIHIHLELIENVIAFESLTYCNAYKYILIELPVRTLPLFVDDILYELGVEGLTPIIAHPERNAVLRENPARLAEWVEQGMLAQVTAGSLTGLMGERAKSTAEQWVRQGLVHLVASDAHNLDRRRPQLSLAYEAITECSSKDTADYFRLRAQSVLLGEAFSIPSPSLKEPRKKRFIFF